MAQVGVAPSSRAGTAELPAVPTGWMGEPKRGRGKRKRDVNGLTLHLSTLDSAQDRTGQTVASTDDSYNP